MQSNHLLARNNMKTSSYIHCPIHTTQSFFIRFIIRISVQFCYNFIFCSYACYLFIQKNFRFCCTNTVIRLIFFEKRTSTVFIFNLWISRFYHKKIIFISQINKTTQIICYNSCVFFVCIMIYIKKNPATIQHCF